jgi:hypothetical protein
MDLLDASRSVSDDLDWAKEKAHVSRLALIRGLLNFKGFVVSKLA